MRPLPPPPINNFNTEGLLLESKSKHTFVDVPWEMCIFDGVLHIHIASVLTQASETTGIPASTLHRGKVKANKKIQMVRSVIARLLVDDGVHPDDIALAFEKTPRSIYSWLAMAGHLGEEGDLLHDYLRSRSKL